LLDPGREQIYHLSDTRSTQVWPAGCRVDPAEVGLAVELRQRVEERRSGRVGLQRRGDVIGKIAALRAFRRQFDDHIIVGRDAGIAHPHRAHRERPSAAVPCNRPADLPAVDRSPCRMGGFGAPHLVWVKRNHDNPAAAGTSSDVGAESLNTHGPWWHGESRARY
jgi:hypothetical protein